MELRGRRGQARGERQPRRGERRTAQKGELIAVVERVLEQVRHVVGPTARCVNQLHRADHRPIQMNEPIKRRPRVEYVVMIVPEESMLRLFGQRRRRVLRARYSSPCLMEILPTF